MPQLLPLLAQDERSHCGSLDDRSSLEQLGIICQGGRALPPPPFSFPGGVPK